MRLPRSFDQLRRVPAERRPRLQEVLLERMAREEWPLVPALRRRLLEAGVDADRASPRDRASGLRPCPLDALTAEAPLQLRPTPDPARIRRHWGPSRKLGLVLARGQGGSLLQRGYLPLEAAAEAHAGLLLESTAHDLELLEEQLWRSAALLGAHGAALVQAPGSSLPPPVEETLALAKLRRRTSGRRPAGPDLLVGCPRAVEAARAAGTPPEQLLCVAQDRGEGPSPPLGRALWMPLLRLLVPTPAGRSDGWLFDDLVQLVPPPAEDGPQGAGLMATHLAHHGTLLARVLLPGSEDWEVRPPDEVGLPRLVWDS